jgi:hypothetical protein
MREEFEKVFPVPYILAAWHESKGEYIPTPAGRSSLTVDVYNRQWQAWQAATALQAEEIERLTNLGAYFNREWNLRGDEIERQDKRVRDLEEALQAVLECGSTSDQWWVDKAKQALSATAREG